MSDGRNIAPKAGQDIARFTEALKNAPVPGRARGRLIFALDATASRRPTWDHACDVQGQMFEEAAKLGGLEVQLVYYRGFGECRASRWAGDAASLVSLMTRVECRAGRTQIARVLRHAEKETQRQRVHALVFIGDCCEESVDELGEIAGRLGLLGLRAFMFQEGVDPTAEFAFKEVARLTGGAFERFDRASPEKLRRLLGAVAAYASGGLDAIRRLPGHEVKRLARQLR